MRRAIWLKEDVNFDNSFREKEGKRRKGKDHVMHMVHEENVNFYDSLSKRGEELYGSKKTSTSTTPLNLSSNESYDAMAGERI